MRKTFAAAALAAPIAAPLPAAAQDAKGAQRQVLARDGPCRPGKRAMIRRAFAGARRMTDDSIAAPTFEPERIQGRPGRFSGPNPARATARNVPAGAGGNGTFAPVRRCGDASEVMGFCPAFFRAARTGQDSQGGIVIREMRRPALGARDHAHQPRGAEARGKGDPAAARMNADSRRYSAEFLPR